MKFWIGFGLACVGVAGIGFGLYMLHPGAFVLGCGCAAVSIGCEYMKDWP